LALVCSVVAFASLAIAGPAGAAKLKVTAHGHVSCTMSGGVITYSPALTNAAAGITATVKANLSCSVGETGDPRVTVTRGKLTGSAPTFIGACGTASPSALNVSVVWKAGGGTVAPTNIALSPVTSPSGSPASYRRGSVSGSYSSEGPQAQFNWKSSCGKKGLKRSSFTGSLDIAMSCSAPIRTEVVPAQVQDSARADNLHIWFVVLPVCPYTESTRPTGTITWGYSDPRNPPVCNGATNQPLADSGLFQANSSIVGAPVRTSTSLSGVDTGINLAVVHGCFGLGNAHYWLRYSGDSRYAPYVYDAGF
jgi:hypothetical protein